MSTYRKEERRNIMNLNEILIDIEYKIIDEDCNLKILKLWNSRHLLYMENNNNQFEIERDYFEFLDGHNMTYSFLLYDKKNNVYYYLDLNKEHNWVKSCFETCEKERIYLGKQVLNNKISIEEIRKKLLKH